MNRLFCNVPWVLTHNPSLQNSTPNQIDHPVFAFNAAKNLGIYDEELIADRWSFGAGGLHFLSQFAQPVQPNKLRRCPPVGRSLRSFSTLLVPWMR